jgi:hypothetical protein
VKAVRNGSIGGQTVSLELLPASRGVFSPGPPDVVSCAVVPPPETHPRQQASCSRRECILRVCGARPSTRVAMARRMEPEPLNVLTVDVEDYYQVEAFSSVVRREDWPRWESRVERNTELLLEAQAASLNGSAPPTSGCQPKFDQAVPRGFGAVTSLRPLQHLSDPCAASSDTSQTGASTGRRWSSAPKVRACASSPAATVSPMKR